MTALREIKPEDRSESVKEVLKHHTERADNYQAILVIALKKDERPVMTTSNCNQHEKTFMTQFAATQNNKWFATGWDLE